MMNRRDFLGSTAGGLLGVALSASAQQSARIPRLGYLSMRPERTEFDAAFVQGLRELGYIDGKSIVIEFRFANFDADRLRAMAADLVDGKIDIIVAEGGTSVSKQLTSTIPIVLPLGGVRGPDRITSARRCASR